MADTDEHDIFEEGFRVHDAGTHGPLAALAFVGGFVYLFLYHPIVWAVLAGASFILAAGLFTTTFFLGMRVGPRSLLVAMPIGLACLGLLWLLFSVVGPTPNPACSGPGPPRHAPVDQWWLRRAGPLSFPVMRRIN